MARVPANCRACLTASRGDREGIHTGQTTGRFCTTYAPVRRLSGRGHDSDEREHTMAITPYLYYDDVRGALQFLAKAFGFRPVGDQMKGPDGRVRHAAMKLGSDLIMMGGPEGGYRNPKKRGQTTQCQYVTIKGVDQHFERARRAGAVVIEEPADTPYGHRRYGVKDPEGHEWYFAQELPMKKSKRTAAAPSPGKRRASAKRR